MRHTNNLFARVMAVWAAAVLSLALATGIFAKVFADEPETTEKIEVEPEVDILGGPFAYTGEQICPTALLVTADVDGDDVILENETDYTFSCGENKEVGADTGVVNLTTVEDSIYVFDDFSVKFPIWANLQEISYETQEIEKTYGDDDFVNPLTKTTVYGEISYYSSDEDVAKVDADGEVTILMPGDAVITAIAAADGEYGEGIATYTLKVNKKSVTIISAEVEDKTYDGTDAGKVTDIEISEEDLEDYEAIATFADKNVGADKNVTVTLKLSNDAARFYDVDAAEYETQATISTFSLEDAIISLSEDNNVYSGTEYHPTVRVQASLNGETDVYLTEGEDFTVEYPEDMTNAGDKTILVHGINNFSDDDELDYEIEPYALTASDVTLEYSITNYDGTAKTPNVTVRVGELVIDASEYTVHYNNNVEAGLDATVIVVANKDANISNYAIKTFEISPKQVLSISGMSNQTVTYTGSPVVLNGNLTVGDNADGITANDLTVTWYDEEGVNVIEQPTDAGSYVVVYSYDQGNYAGSLTVEFTIAKAESPMPAEMTAGLVAEVGDMLDSIDREWTDGFSWVDNYAVVSAGNHTYPATYTYDDDDWNYTTLQLDVPVYGITRIYIDVEVDTDGGEVEYPDEVFEGDKAEIKFLPMAGWEIRKVMLNGMEVTSSVIDNKLVLTAGTTDVDVLVSFRRIYNVIEGSGMNYVIGSGELASFRFDVDHELFVNGGKVYVDDMLIGDGYYTHTSGSTIITFTEEFMNFIGDGEHTIAVVFGDGGIARTNFTVANSTNPIKTPDTGFFTGKGFAAQVISVITIITGIFAGGFVLKNKFARTKVDFDKK